MRRFAGVGPRIQAWASAASAISCARWTRVRAWRIVVRDRVMANDVRRMISRLDTSTVLLNEDLLALQSNWSFRRCFKQQAKAAEKEGKWAPGLKHDAVARNGWTC